MSGSLRASDADREAASERLRRATGEGRLTVPELEARLDTAYRAQTRSELDLLVADLPPEEPASPGELTTPAGRIPVRRRAGGTGWVVAVMGGAVRRGRWRLAPTCRVINVMGGADIDLTDAELGADQVELTVLSVMGGSRIRVPESLRVDVSKLALMGGNEVHLEGGAPDPGGPVLRLRLVSIMGGAEVRRGPLPPRSSRRRGRLPSGRRRPGELDR